MKKKSQIKKKQKVEQKDLLVFSHRRLPKKAREFQHEITHLTLSLIEINRKVYESGQLAQLRPHCFAGEHETKHLVHTRHSDYILDLNYHIENFILRLQAYRDKIALFVNFALDMEFTDSDMGLIFKIKDRKLSKQTTIDTELKKLTEKTSPAVSLLEKRKKISHKLYYNSPDYNPLFIPKEIDPKKVGRKTAGKKWKANIISEINKVDSVTKTVLKINEAIALKIVKFYTKV